MGGRSLPGDTCGALLFLKRAPPMSFTECGTSQSNQRRSAHTQLVRKYLADQSQPHWVNTYQDALVRYRSAAGVALRNWLDALDSNGAKENAAGVGAGAK